MVNAAQELARIAADAPGRCEQPPRYCPRKGAIVVKGSAKRRAWRNIRDQTGSAVVAAWANEKLRGW